MRQHRDTVTKWLLLLTLAVALSACGFHLRGKPNLPFKSIFLATGANSSMSLELKRYLKASGITVVDDRKDAEAVFQMIAEARDRRASSTTPHAKLRSGFFYERSDQPLRQAATTMDRSPSAQIL